MSDLLTGYLSKPTNEKIGKFFKVRESTIRERKKQNLSTFEQNLREYRLKIEPFISIEDYNLENDTDFKPEQVLNKEIPGILNRDGSVLVPTVLEDILSLITELKKTPGCNVISLSNYKGGVGKTTVGVNIGVILSFFGFKVLFVDGDLQGNTTSMFNLYRYKKFDHIDLEINKIEDLYNLEGSDFKYTVVDLMAEAGKDKLEQMVKDSIINLNHKTKTNGRIDIIPNSCNIENVLKFEDIDKHLRAFGNVNKALDEVLSYVKNDYDFVIIDTPPDISLPLRMAAMASDYFIIPLTADKMGRDGIAPFFVPIEMQKDIYRREKGKDIVILGGVLNKYQENSNVQKNNKDFIDKTLQVNSENANLGNTGLFEQTIKYSNAFNEAQYQTGSILIDNPTNELVRDNFNLTIEIIDKIIIDKRFKNKKQ